MAILRYHSSPFARRSLLDDWPAFSPLGVFGALTDFRLPENLDQTLPAAIDVLTRDSDLVLKVELPGIDPEKDIDISLDRGRLTITGERRFETDEKTEQYHRIERAYGRFERSVPVPSHVSEEDVSATYLDGVLEVVVKNGATDRPESSRIPISIGTRESRASGDEESSGDSSEGESTSD